MTSKRVLVVASTFPAGPSDTVPRFVHDQVVALRAIRPDWQVTVLAPHDARSGTRDRVEHVDFTELRFHYVWPRRWESLAGHGIMPAIRRNPLQLLAVPLLFLHERRALARTIREVKPHIVYAHWFTPQAVTAAPVAHRASIPFVFTTHASDVAVWARFGRLGSRVVRSIVRRTARLTAVSQTSLDRMRSFFSETEWNTEIVPKAAVIPMGVELTTHHGDAAPESYPGRRVVLFMGRLAEKKGVKLLLDAFSTIHDEREDTLLVIAGDGPLRAELEARTEELGISDAVDFVGYATGAHKDALYRRADLCVLPSILTSDGDTEGLPVSLLEALAYGRPTVATDATNAQEVLTPGVDGLLVRSGSVSALTDGLIEILDAEPHRSTEMEAAARSTASGYAWHRIAERTAKYLLDPYLEG